MIDLDVHQGDGTAAIFENDPEVLTISMHGENNFPVPQAAKPHRYRAAGRHGGCRVSRARAEVLPEVAPFRPEIVFYQSGVDGLAGDRLGRLALTHAGLQSGTGWSSIGRKHAFL